MQDDISLMMSDLAYELKKIPQRKGVLSLGSLLIVLFGFQCEII
jgi:hypothetical protein